MASVPSWWNRTEILDPGWSDYLVWGAAVTNDVGVTYLHDEFRAKKADTKQIVRTIAAHREATYVNGRGPDLIPLYVDPEDPRFINDLNQAGKELGVHISAIPADNDVQHGFLAGMTRIRSNNFFVTHNCTYVIDCLNNHAWSGRLSSKGAQIEERDEWKHGSDISRYLQLTPLMTSRKPLVEMPGRETFRDLLGLGQGLNRGWVKSTFEAFKEMHRRAT